MKWVVAEPSVSRLRHRAEVLVVDTDPDVVERLVVSLRFHGFGVHTAANGLTALDRAHELRPDAVIWRLHYPGSTVSNFCPGCVLAASMRRACFSPPAPPWETS